MTKKRTKKGKKLKEQAPVEEIVIDEVAVEDVPEDAEIVETIEIPVEDLQILTGQYLLDYQVDGIGDYLIDVTLEDSKLVITDPNNGEVNRITPLEKLKFIDLETGDGITFQLEAKTGVLFNDRFQFYKVEE